MFSTQRESYKINNYDNETGNYERTTCKPCKFLRDASGDVDLRVDRWLLERAFYSYSQLGRLGLLVDGQRIFSLN
jgi:hypothetical protein